jgi:predicted RNA-binding protein with PIN domain
MNELLIVDGYNMIGAWPELAKLKDINLEEARDRLIDMLSEYQGFSGHKVYLIFDAHQIPGLGGKYEQGKLEIYYTKEKETADELIERLVSRLISRKNRISVATSDMAEQSVVFGLGALRIPASELLRKIRQNKQDIQKQIAQSPPPRNSFDSRLDSRILDILERKRREK